MGFIYISVAPQSVVPVETVLEAKHSFPHQISTKFGLLGPRATNGRSRRLLFCDITSIRSIGADDVELVALKSALVVASPTGKIV